MTENVHQSVLLNEVIENLNFQKGDVFLDATLGGGGHSAEVARRFGDKVEIIGLDLDPKALSHAKKVVNPFSKKFTFEKANFRDLDKVLDRIGKPKVNKILFDLGLSSNELQSSGRGFSFKNDEPLIMTFSSPEPGELSSQHKGGAKLPHPSLTAREIVNLWEEENIADVIFGYGGEKFSRRIAKEIVKARKVAPIETTYQLVHVIRKGVPAWYTKQKTHFATRTFQALRITVNDELGALKEGIEKGFERLQPEGIMAVISFHSLEDRIAKQFFNEKKKEGSGSVITKKPIVPERAEIQANPRSRSAKLRVISKI